MCSTFAKDHSGTEDNKNVKNIIIQFIKGLELGVVNIFCVTFREENKNLTYQNTDEVFYQTKGIISQDNFFIFFELKLYYTRGISTFSMEPHIPKLTVQRRL